MAMAMGGCIVLSKRALLVPTTFASCAGTAFILSSALGQINRSIRIGRSASVMQESNSTRSTGRILQRTHPTSLAADGRRRLESDPFQCPKLDIPLPRQPPLPTLRQSTYAASFPGSGDRMITKYLVEALTGIYVGEASVSPSLVKMSALSAIGGGGAEEEGGNLINGEAPARGQGDVVVVRTQFPHTSGKLASWNDDIPRAFVVLRNPLHAIPCYFNKMYEMRNHLPTGSSTHSENSKDARKAWIKWRDHQLHSQNMLYRRFVSFWMERYLGAEGDRLYFSYEEFVNEESGPQEAVRLASFLEAGMRASAMEWVMSSVENLGLGEGDGSQPFGVFMAKGLSPDQVIDSAIGEAMKTMVPPEDVPCLWKEIVQSTVSNPSMLADDELDTARSLHQEELQQEEQSAGRTYLEGGDCWIPEERPYTPENLAAMSQMLLELMNRWSRHLRLLNILSKYHREVNKVYLESVANRSGGEGQ